MTPPGDGSMPAGDTVAAVEPRPAHDETAEQVSSGPLHGTIRRGLALSFVNTLLTRLGTFIAGVVLARLLVPEDYGVFAVALVVLNAVLSINELGVSLAVVRWPGEPRRIAPTVMTLAVASSAVMCALTFVAAPTVARLLGSTQATGVIRLLAVGVLIDGIVSVPAALLTRYLMQGRRLCADLLTLVVASGLTLWLAATGHGAWSLGWGYVAGNLAGGMLIFVLAPVHVVPGLDRAVLAELISFGLPLAGASLLVFGVLNVDYIVVGHLLGPVQLGIYLLAFNLSSWPVNLISVAVRRVALAAFSKINSDGGAVSDAFGRSLALLLAVSLPVCALLALLSGPLVRCVYGQHWAAAAAPLRWLAVLGLFRILYELCYDLLVALGRSRAVLAIQAVWLACLVPALTLGAHLGGLRELAMAHALVAGLVVGPLFLVMLSRAGISWQPVWRGLARPLVGTAVLIVGVITLTRLVHGDAMTLVLAGAVGVGLHAAVVLPMRRLVTVR